MQYSNYSPYVRLLKRYEVLISSAIVIVATVALFIAVLIPNFTKSESIHASENQLATRLKLLNQKNQDLTSMDAKLYEETLSKLYTVLPYQKDYVSLFNRFDALQNETGVTILRTEFQLGVVSTNSAQLAKQQKKGAFVLPMSVGVSGTKEQVVKFVEALTDLSGRMITPSSIQWQESQDGQLTAQISGNAYFSLLPTTIGNIDTPIDALDKPKQAIFDKIAKAPLSPESQLDTSGVKVGKQDLFQ